MYLNKKKLIRDEIRERISCYEYAKVFGIQLSDDYHFRSLIDPGGSMRSASIHPTDNYWTDWKTQTHGDVIQMCMWHQFNENTPFAYGQAIRFLSNYLHIDSFDYDTYKRYLTDYENDFELYHQAITDEIYQYFYDRGFNKNYIDSRNIGYCTINNIHKDRIIIPYKDENGNYVYCASRRLPSIDKTLAAYNPKSDEYKKLNEKYPKYKKDIIKEYNQHIIWGLDTLSGERKAKDVLVLAEGIVDAMSWDYEGYHVVSPVTGNFNKEQETKFLTLAKRFKYILITFDNDTMGTEFTEKMMKKLFNNHISFKVAIIPKEDGKDVNDYFVKHHELQSLMNNAEDGIKHLLNSYDSWNDLESLINRQARFLSEIEIASLVHKIDFEHFGLNATEKMKNNLISKLLKAPTETQVIEEIKKAYNLIYIDMDGFYIYEHGVWCKHQKIEIEKIIGEFYGKRFNTATRKSNTYNNMCSECVQRITFNENPVMTFLNGTLDIDSGKFRKSRPTDYCTIQLDYSYDPTAKNEKWIEFIKDVTNQNEERITLLQEIGGYVLYPINQFEKCFFFMGNGSNGKSVFMEIVKEVYGKSNCSAVPLSTLNDKFSVIHLRHALINIDEETEYDIRGNEKGLVKLASRDTEMRGCFKGKDFVEFCPRAKAIYLLNDMVQTEDNTHSFRRRLTFVKFPNTYYQADELPRDRELFSNEKLADVNLVGEIKKNPCGVFNWFYQGYKRLRENDRFSDSVDDAEYKEEMNNLSDPIKSFVEWLYSGESVSTLRGNFVTEAFWDSAYESCIRTQIEYLQNDNNQFRMSRSDMYKLYCAWAKGNGRKQMTQQNFTRRFNQKTEQKLESHKSNNDHYYRLKA